MRHNFNHSLNKYYLSYPRKTNVNRTSLKQYFIIISPKIMYTTEQGDIRLEIQWLIVNRIDITFSTGGKNINSFLSILIDI